MRRATLGAAVILLTGYLAACSDPAPPAGTVHHEALVVAAPDETTTGGTASVSSPSPEEPQAEAPVTESEPTTTVPPEPGGPDDPWGPILCPGAAHPFHHKPCPVQTARTSPPVTSGGVRPSVPRSAPVETTGTGRCGGSLPPCSVMQQESGGNLTIYNTEGSGASGKWQFMPGTWDGYGGYANAADAPEAVQDDKAAETWAGGAGCSHWSAC